MSEWLSEKTTGSRLTFPVTGVAPQLMRQVWWWWGTGHCENVMPGKLFSPGPKQVMNTVS